MKIQLTKAIKHKGQDIFSLDIPLEDLTGNDLIEVEESIMKSEDRFIVTDFSRSYIIAIAAKAAHMPPEALRAMSAKDFTKVINGVRLFLNSSDSGKETPEETETIPESTPAIS